MRAQNHTINKEMQILDGNLKSERRIDDTLRYLSSCEGGFVKSCVSNVIGQVDIRPRLQSVTTHSLTVHSCKTHR